MGAQGNPVPSQGVVAVDAPRIPATETARSAVRAVGVRRDQDLDLEGPRAIVGRERVGFERRLKSDAARRWAPR